MRVGESESVRVSVRLVGGLRVKGGGGGGGEGEGGQAVMLDWFETGPSVLSERISCGNLIVFGWFGSGLEDILIGFKMQEYHVDA